MDKPLAADARLCRCSGYFRDAAGAPRTQLDIHFIATFRPAILDDALVMDERRVIKTNEDGWGCVDLVRGACYSVTLETWEGEQRYIRVPDAPCANLPDVLFPVVGSIVQPSIAVTVGESVEQTPIVLDSAGVSLEGTAVGDVLWKVADPTIASVAVERDKLTVYGISVGATELMASRADNSIVKIPDTGIVGSPVEIMVG